MKLDLQSLSSEPLVYMLMHSGAFATALGIIFFLIGLLFGRLTWGRYKGQSRELRAEAEATKEEVANLKRKLADLSVKTGPAVPMVTEMIAMPKKSSPATSAPPPAPVASEARKSVLPPSVAPPASAPAPQKSREPQPDVIKSKPPAEAEPASNGANAAPLAPLAAPAVPPPPQSHASVTIPIMQDAASAAVAHASTLAAIIAPTAAPKKEADSLLAKDMLVLPEIPIGESPSTPAAPRASKPDFDFDFQLGLVYRSKPDHADDLTALKGVASTLERRLQALGVYTYEQIASWTPDQVREFSSRLAFKDRIEREQWVEQARELLASQQAKKRQLEASLA